MKVILNGLKEGPTGRYLRLQSEIPAHLTKHEREHLRPVANSIFRKNSHIGREKRIASEKACISVETSSYQLPLKYRNKTVEIYVSKHKLFVFDLWTGEEIISYELSPIPGKILSKREHRRETEKTAQELKALVCQMFESKNRKSFTARNFKTFSRYVRDQCLEAKRYFLVKDIDLDILEQALQYCLKNDTLSFSNLNDTYAYFKRESQGSHDILKEIQTLERQYQGGHEP